jgi:hypothetical protein
MRERTPVDIDESEGRFRTAFIAALKAREIPLGKRGEQRNLLDHIYACGLSIDTLREILRYHVRTWFDEEVEYYVSHRTEVAAVARTLRASAKGMRFLKLLHWPYHSGPATESVQAPSLAVRTRREMILAGELPDDLTEADVEDLFRSRDTPRPAGRVDEDVLPDLDRFADSQVPREWRDPQTTPDELQNLYDSFWFGLGMSPVTPEVDFRSLLVPCDLIELFEAPPLMPGRSVMFKSINRKRQEKIERVKNKRGMDWARRRNAAPIDLENIARILDDLAGEVQHAAEILKRPSRRRTRHAERSFRRAFAEHAKAVTGRYQDEIGAAIFSMTFHAVEVADYKRMRQIDSAGAKKAGKRK